ncbi:MAG TPA: heavy metal-responsive transcriptional regulator [Pyrinomonadaceae bacterium]|nr:heavy metal-responsive transcriptional regulator [Pyrinomonadaceae bacterium]
MQKDFWRAGELAKAAGVSTDTLRHYERKGVLAAPRRSRNGYREYPAEALERVRLVRRALSVGFTLDELARIIKARAKGEVPCRAVRALAARKLANLEAQLTALTLMRDELSATLSDWDSLLAEKADGERAGLLESLASGSRHTERAPTPAWRRRKSKERMMGNGKR